MQPNTVEEPINHKKNNKLGKSPYARPVLRVFGSVGILTHGALGTKCDGSNVGDMQLPPCSSDRSLKENIARVGTHPLGFGLYLFNYKTEFHGEWGSGRQFGVMAQEVETVMPEAVSIHPNGYKMVNYALLGISRHIQ